MAIIAQTSGACSETPAQVVEPGGYISIKNAGPVIGYRLAGFRWDPLLRQRWAMIATCGHPERPVIAIEVMAPDHGPHAIRNSGGANPTHVLPAVVHVGDVVHLWSQDKTIRIELTGVAEQGAAIGQRIRVRLLQAGLPDGGPPPTLFGMVRGVRDVEIEQ